MHHNHPRRPSGARAPKEQRLASEHGQGDCPRPYGQAHAVAQRMRRAARRPACQQPGERASEKASRRLAVQRLRRDGPGLPRRLRVRWPPLPPAAVRHRLGQRHRRAGVRHLRCQSRRRPPAPRQHRGRDGHAAGSRRRGDRRLPLPGRVDQRPAPLGARPADDPVRADDPRHPPHEAPRVRGGERQGPAHVPRQALLRPDARGLLAARLHGLAQALPRGGLRRPAAARAHLHHRHALGRTVRPSAAGPPPHDGAGSPWGPGRCEREPGHVSHLEQGQAQPGAGQSPLAGGRAGHHHPRRAPRQRAVALPARPTHIAARSRTAAILPGRLRFRLRHAPHRAPDRQRGAARARLAFGQSHRRTH